MTHRRLSLLSAFLTLVLLASSACASRTAPPATTPAAASAAAPATASLPDSVVWFRTSVEYPGGHHAGLPPRRADARPGDRGPRLDRGA